MAKAASKSLASVARSVLGGTKVGARGAKGDLVGGNMERIVRLGLRVLLGFVLLVIGHIVAKFVEHAVSTKGGIGLSPAVSNSGNSVAELEASAQMGASRQRLDPTAVVLGSVCYWLILGLSVLLILALLGVQVASVIAVLAGVGVVVGFAMQGVLSDLSSGMLIAITNVFLIGDLIQVGGPDAPTVTGTVVGFNIVNTTLVDASTQTVATVPNRVLQENVVANLTRRPYRRVTVDALLSNKNEDFVKIAKIMQETLDKDAALGVTVYGRPHVGVQNMGDVGTVMRIAFVIASSDYTQSKLMTLRLRVRNALALNKVILVDPF